MKQIIITILTFLAIPVGLYLFLAMYQKNIKGQEPEKSLAIQVETDMLYKKNTKYGKMEITLRESRKQKEFDRIGNIILEIESLWKRGDVEQLYSLINKEYLGERQLIYKETDMRIKIEQTIGDFEGREYSMHLQNITKLSKYYLIQIRFLCRELEEPDLIYNQNTSKDVAFLLFFEEGSSFSFIPFLPDDLAESAGYINNEDNITPFAE